MAKEINFVDIDASSVEQNVITTYEQISGKSLAPGDPVRLFLEALAYLLAQQRSAIDYAAKQNLLAYSEGDFLDHLGRLTDTERLEAKSAQTTLRFEIAEEMESTVLIPEGTRVTPGEQLYFATDETAEISAGDTSVTVSATCKESGSKGNGYVAGQISKLVDPVEHVTSVENTTTSLGGTDQESDENLRERIRLAPEKYSSAGPNLGYRYWALEAHQDIIDVSVLSPAPGQVAVYVLMQGGELPEQSILDDVEAEVSAEKRRPLSDQVSVSAPERVSYDIDLTYYISTADSTRASAIKDAVQQAVDDFVSWQKDAIGRDINPSELIRRVQQAGAKRVRMDSPSFQSVDDYQVASDGTVSVTYGGLEDA